MNILDDNFKFATKSTSVNARGKKRTIGKGKKASAYTISPTNSDIEIEAIERKEKNNKKKLKNLQYNENKKIAENQIINLSNPIQSGSSKLFRGQRKSKTLLPTVISTIDRTSNFFSIDTVYSENFYKNLKLIDPYYNNRIKIRKQRIDYDGYQWSFQLQSNFNLLLYGVGCKKSLIQTFAKTWLAGEDVIEINGNISCDNITESINYQGKSILKQIIEVITTSILTKSENYLFQTQSSLDIVCKNLVNLLNIHYGRNEGDNNNALNEDECNHSMINNNNNIIYDSEDCYDSTNEDENNDNINSMKKMNKNVNDNRNSNEDVNKNLSNDEQNIILHNLLYDVGDGNINNISSYNRRSNRSNVLNNNGYSNYNNGVSKNIEKIIEADPRWGGRFTQAKSRLYIMIHGIDGNALQLSEIQACLSILSSSTSVSIIASSDSINCPMLWSDLVHARFKWLFYHVPTFEIYRNSIRNLEKNRWNKENTNNNSEINYILQSLIPRHREVLRYICKDSIDRRKNIDILMKKNINNNNKNKIDIMSKGITLDELSSYCTSKMITKTISELKILLNELSDQNLISFLNIYITHKLSTEYELTLANEAL